MPDSDLLSMASLSDRRGVYRRLVRGREVRDATAFRPTRSEAFISPSVDGVMSCGDKATMLLIINYFFYKMY
jgi:hypothetical protein